MISYREDWIDEIHVNEWNVVERAKFYDKKPSKVYRTLESLLLVKAITLIDFSTLFGDDSFSNVTALVNKGAQPITESLLGKVLQSVTSLIENLNSSTVKKTRSLSITVDTDEGFNFKFTDSNDVNEKYGLNYEEFVEVKQLLTALHLDDENLNDSLSKFLHLKNHSSECKNEIKKTVRVAAVCVYPAFVGVVAEQLKNKKLLASLAEDITAEDVLDNETVDELPIASVAAGFPTGLFPLDSKMSEMRYAIENGATEIDIVISRYLVLGHRWFDLFNEIYTLRKTCGNAKMKTILAVGECGSLENIYKSSMVVMMAGTDFIKTSTGKEAVNATFASGLVMCRAIKNFYLKTGKKIGFKPAGGVRTAEDSLKWINLIVSELGVEWLSPSLFRIGASGVLKNIEQRLEELNS